MDEEIKKRLAADPDGLITYEFIANNIDSIDPVLPELVDNMISVDACGQFCVSAARYLNAIDAEKHAPAVSRLIAAAIDKDREHRYLPDLLTGLYGEDCVADARRLSASDDNFRRIYKRLYPASDSF